MEDPRDDGGRGVQELEVVFERGEVRRGGGRCGPEEGVVVGEEREEDAEEEGGCWEGSVSFWFLTWALERGGGMKREIAVRQRIMNVAKDWERLPKAMIVGIGDGFEGMVG